MQKKIFQGIFLANQGNSTFSKKPIIFTDMLKINYPNIGAILNNFTLISSIPTNLMVIGFKNHFSPAVVYFEIKIGINSGEVVAGIVGIKKFAYDIWGDAVNTAARMKARSENGKINVGSTTYELAKSYFDFSYRGELEIKGKGLAKMYFVETKTN